MIDENISKTMDMASYAGKILLESGADIVRVEDTVRHIMISYGIRDFEVFTVANGIFLTTGVIEKRIDTNIRRDFLRIRSIPLTSTNLGKVDAVNTLSRQIENGEYQNVDDAFTRLCEIDAMKPRSAPMRLFGSALASMGLCYTFGGSFVDSAVAFIVGFLFYASVVYLDEKKLSRLLTNIICSITMTVFSVIFTEIIGIGVMDRVMIGCLMPLVPGVSFTNSIRDIAAGNYISGLVRMVDAVLIAIGIGIGVGVTILAVKFVGII